MRRINWKTVSTLVAVFAVAACAEQTVAPEASSATSMRFAPADRPALSVNHGASSSASVDFTVGPDGGVFLVGTNVLSFPKGSICDPALSSYGEGTWDAPCTPLRTSIRIHAETRVLNGYSWVDFTPSLRFVPSSDASRWVWLAMMTSPNPSLDPSLYKIYFTPNIGGTLYDDARSDPTMRTYVDPSGRLSLRRIKHFTGYGSSSGRTCPAEGADTTTCPSGGQP